LIYLHLLIGDYILLRTGINWSDFHMSKYATNWVDCKLATGQEFAIAVCGYSAKIRHMYIGSDPLRRMLVQFVNVDEAEGFCHTGDHCLALDCPLNRAEPEHLLHMLDMNEDEPLPPEEAKQWGTSSTLECFLKFAQKALEFVPEELKKPQPPVAE
jgi:hypothetical protein